MACRHSAVNRGESERKARTANQLVPASPVAKKLGVAPHSGQRGQSPTLIGQIEREQ